MARHFILSAIVVSVSFQLIPVENRPISDKCQTVNATGEAVHRKINAADLVADLVEQVGGKLSDVTRDDLELKLISNTPFKI